MPRRHRADRRVSGRPSDRIPPIGCTRIRNGSRQPCAGFRSLLVAAKLAETTKGTLALCSLSAEVQRLFDLGAFTDLFVIYSSREEGLSKLS